MMPPLVSVVVLAATMLVTMTMTMTATAAAAFAPPGSSSFAAANSAAISRRAAVRAAEPLRASASHERDCGGDAPESANECGLTLGRREVISRAGSAAAALAALSLQPRTALADGNDESLTSRMFNPDGSLKTGTVEEVEAKSRAVEASFPSAGSSSADAGAAVVSVDGVAVPSQSTGGDGDKAVKVSYTVPQKWSSSPDSLYLDPSEGVNARAARRIAVYRLPTPADEKTLDKATTIGVAKALGVPTVSGQIGFAKSILGADLVSGRKSVRDGIKYYEFDLAVAPDTCDDDKNVGTTKSANLGLGFCPYDSVVLLGAAVAEDGRMYVISVESDRDMWKRANADLKRVRSSFRVEVPP